MVDMSETVPDLGRGPQKWNRLGIEGCCIYSETLQLELGCPLRLCLPTVPDARRRIILLFLSDLERKLSVIYTATTPSTATTTTTTTAAAAAKCISNALKSSVICTL